MAEPTITDPIAAWREWLSTSERQWNTFLNQAMSTDEFAQSMGRMMDVYLGMQKSMGDMLGKYFQSLNLPTRTDILALGQRLSGIEERLAGLERVLAALNAPEAGAPAEERPAPATARPPRTKRPA
jgi:polyhydroxyalkanoic acid synthase PhaR subunit